MHRKLFRNGLVLCAAAYLALDACAALAQSTPTTETLVFVRHGEKPADVDNGQLTCQGFNRSIALATVLLSRFGMPNYLFAAEPVEKQDDNGNNYYYLRALATIEPTAVAAGQTVNLKYDKSDIDGMENELMKSTYQSSLVFVAWEHTEMDELVANIVHDNGGDSSVVPAWPDDDYDSIFVVTLVRSNNQTLTSFFHDFEGLDNQGTVCPSGIPNGRPPQPLLLPHVRAKPLAGIKSPAFVSEASRASS